MPHGTGQASQLWPRLAPPLVSANMAPLSRSGRRRAWRWRAAARTEWPGENQAGESPPEGLAYSAARICPCLMALSLPRNPSKGRLSGIIHCGPLTPLGNTGWRGDRDGIAPEPHPLAVTVAHLKPLACSSPIPGFSASFPINPQTRNLVAILCVLALVRAIVGTGGGPLPSATWTGKGLRVMGAPAKATCTV